MRLVHKQELVASMGSEGKGKAFSHLLIRGRRGGLMVSMLDSGLSSPGLSLGWGTALCSWARHLTLIVALFVNPGVLMGTGEFTAGGNPAMY